ncbi:uncharacterized protein LOC133831119 [Humulus lupulus]|uniref:uncharacterized protein LOC133831119 n=1 Tax=Humulus lupulus TaxID=3486 RepID=UPI002B4017F8|nr:uncharacterized protein LOC133831119 [Humulus lupulus]
MEYLTRLLIQASHNKDFRFHPLCKRLKFVSLCFADDLVIFCKCTLRSVQILQDGFQKFSQASGLTANMTKSHIYFGGLKFEEKKSILDCIKIEEGTFPLKYLGVPLRPTKWKAGDCGPIIKKINLRLHTWSSRHLSFVGRAQLIHSTLLGLRCYWMSIFILPQSVTKEIDRLCKNFLWGERGNRSKLHFTSWEQENASYANVVWCKLSIPKHRFIMWQSVQGHLLTRDKLLHCHVRVDSNLCPLCEIEMETHAHLFFDCDFSQRLMIRVRDWLGAAIWPSKYPEWLNWMEGRPNGLLQKIAATALAAAIYFIWLNRNSCVFDCIAYIVQRVGHLIKECMKARMLSLARKNLLKKEKAMFDFICKL